MLVIRVEMFKRTQEQKRNLARELTEAFVNTCGGNKEAIKILLIFIFIPYKTILLLEQKTNFVKKSKWN